MVKMTSNVNSSCVNDNLVTAAVAYNQSCWSGCPQPTNMSSPCWVKCLFDAVAGNTDTGQKYISWLGHDFEHDFEPPRPRSPSARCARPDRPHAKARFHLGTRRDAMLIDGTTVLVRLCRLDVVTWHFQAHATGPDRVSVRGLVRLVFADWMPASPAVPGAVPPDSPCRRSLRHPPPRSATAATRCPAPPVAFKIDLWAYDLQPLKRAPLMPCEHVQQRPHPQHRAKPPVVLTAGILFQFQVIRCWGCSVP